MAANRHRPNTFSGCLSTTGHGKTTKVITSGSQTKATAQEIPQPPHRGSLGEILSVGSPPPLSGNVFLADRLALEREETKHGFLATCEIINKRLQKLNDKYNKELFDETQFQETHRQFNEKEIFISVSGRYNCGKSTLLNALLGSRILPVKKMSETSTMMVIQHDQGIHYGACPQPQSCLNCPKLSIKSRGHVVVETRGEKKIYDELKELNERIRRKAQDIGQLVVKITMNVPVLSDAPEGWYVSLVDTPGFGEDDTSIARLANSSLKASSAYVYVVNTDTIGCDTDAHYFQMLKEKDEGAFSKDRLVVVVTKFDDNYNDDPFEPECITEDEAREKSRECIVKATKFDVSPNIVLLVSGLWAYAARELARIPDGTVLSVRQNEQRAAVSRYLSKYPDYACGQAEDTGALSSTVLAIKLEIASGISTLERRIKHMSNQCVHLWVHKMSGDYNSYLRAANDKLSMKLKDKKEDTDRIQDALEEKSVLYGAVRDIQKYLKKDMAEGSVVHQLMQDEYDEDVERDHPEERGRRVVKRLVEDFKDQCLEQIENRHGFYGPAQFDKDLEEFFKDAAKQLEDTFNAACKFTRCFKQQRRCERAMTESYTILRQKAGKLCGKEMRPSEVRKRVSSGVGGVEEALQSPDLALVKAEVPVPGVTFSWWMKVKAWFKLLFKERNKEGEKSLDSYRTGDLSETMCKLEEMLGEECGKYIGIIKPHVVKYFFGQYCKETGKKLHAFKREFGSGLDKTERDIDDLKTKIEKQTAVLEELKEICQHLTLMQDCLCTQTDFYKP